MTRRAALTLLISLLLLLAQPVHSPATAAQVVTGNGLTWGYNQTGQIGNGSQIDRTAPAVVSGLGAVVAVAAGQSHSLALLSDGTVRAWGDNPTGQLGDGTNTRRTTPVPVTGLTGVVAISAGASHSLAVLGDGTVRAWGWNGRGQLGDGTEENRSTPVAVPGLTGVVAVAAGLAYSVALLNDGTVRAWGINGNGQLGDGTTSEKRLTPAPVVNLSGAVAIAAGDQHNLALLSDGTVRAWGSNLNGKLGDGTQANRNLPVTVPGLGGVVAIAAGAGHSLAVLGDGTARAWGSNDHGQLGDGTTTQRLTPVSVTGLSGATDVAAGTSHSLARTSDGTVRAWGYNFAGQLGDSTTTQRLTPVVAVGLGGVVAITAGWNHSLAISSLRFGDVPTTALAHDAIDQLASRGIINGCDATASPPLFCPADTTLRHQMAALIVRAMPGWQAETWVNTFTDPTDDIELWGRVATLQHYGVVSGYTAESCVAQGKGVPCYGPLDSVLKAQAISFVTRAMVKKGYWEARSADPNLYGGALAGTGHEADAATYWYYTRGRGGVPDYPEVGPFPLGDAATRGWFARLLWTAIQGSPAAP